MMKKSIVICILLFLASACTFASLAGNFDTLLHLRTLSKHDRFIAYDAKIFDDGHYLLLYEKNHELYVYDSRKTTPEHYLEAFTRLKSGDKLPQREDMQVRDPAFYGNGKYVIAPTDLDQDGKGGRFARWNLESGLMDFVETDDWGIDIYAISSDGRYFINYYSEKPGKHLHLLDSESGKSYKIKLRYVMYAENIFFSTDNNNLLFQSVLRDRSFRDVAYHIPDFTEVEPANLKLCNPYLDKRAFLSKDLRIGADILDKHLKVTDYQTAKTYFYKEMEAQILSVSPNKTRLIVVWKNETGDLILIETSPERLIDL